MNAATIKALNKINTHFYNQIAEEFDSTRQNPWPGWQKLLPRLPAKPSIAVLDIGCGNGRFASFLTKNKIKIDYLGTDNNSKLINLAKNKLSKHPTIKFNQIDLLNQQLKIAKKYDLIVCFGFLHHIPSFKLRLNFLKQLPNLLAINGILALSTWKFYEQSRFRKKIVSWDKVNTINPAQLEKHDYLLNWGRGVQNLRYCHFIDKVEEKKLIQNINLNTINSYRSDGKSKNLNQYYILTP